MVIAFGDDETWTLGGSCEPVKDRRWNPRQLGKNVLNQKEKMVWVSLTSKVKTLLSCLNTDKFYNKEEVPWVSEINLAWTLFWWADSSCYNRKMFFLVEWYFKACDLFKGITNYNIGDGSTVLFWSDLWNGNVMQIKYPRLLSFARNKKTSVSQFLTNNNLDQFHLPLLEQAYQQYQSLQGYIQIIQVQPNTKDLWHYI